MNGLPPLPKDPQTPIIHIPPHQNNQPQLHSFLPTHTTATNTSIERTVHQIPQGFLAPESTAPSQAPQSENFLTYGEYQELNSILSDLNQQISKENTSQPPLEYSDTLFLNSSTLKNPSADSEKIHRSLDGNSWEDCSKKYLSEQLYQLLQDTIHRIGYTTLITSEDKIYDRFLELAIKTIPSTPSEQAIPPTFIELSTKLNHLKFLRQDYSSNKSLFKELNRKNPNILKQYLLDHGLEELKEGTLEWIECLYQLRISCLNQEINDRTDCTNYLFQLAHPPRQRDLFLTSPFPAHQQLPHIRHLNFFEPAETILSSENNSQILDTLEGNNEMA